MLPRSGLPLKPKVHLTKDNEIDERENTKALGNRSNMGVINKPKLIQGSVNNKQRISPKPQNSPPHPQPQNTSQRRNSVIQNVISTVNNATNVVANNLSGLGNSPNQFYSSQGFNNSPGYSRSPQVNNFININSANNFLGNDRQLSH